MWAQKLIQSAVIAGTLSFALPMGGCASADRSEQQERSEPSGGSPSHPPADDAGDDDSRQYAHGKSDEDGRVTSSGAAARSTGSQASAKPRTTRADSAVTAAPSIDELPDLKPQRRRAIAARVDVEGSLETTKRPVVPSYKELPLTDEEKKALGKDREKPDDVLAFYKPQPSTEKGVLSHDGGAQIGISGPGGASVGIGRNPPRVETFGQAGYNYGSYGPARHASGVGIGAPIIARVGPSFVVLIGWGPKRPGAGQTPDFEP